MKAIPIALTTHYAQETTTIARALKIERTDGNVYGFTAATRDAAIDGVVYLSAPGLDSSQLESSSGLNVDNAELTIIPDDTLITLTDLIAGRWDNAAFELFEYNYEAASDDVNVLKRGSLGEVRPNSGNFIVELRGLTQALQQPVGRVTQRTCAANFCDYPIARPNTLCRLDPEDWTVTGAITNVTNNQIFRDENRTEPEDWFGEGIITFTSGANVDLSQKVKIYTALGFITLVLPMLFEVQPGDEYSMLAGCRKRHDVDCRDKFDNILNFQGEPHLSGLDAVSAAPD